MQQIQRKFVSPPFQAYAIKIHSKDEVKMEYMQIRQMNKYADHIIAVYRLKIGDDVTQGYADNKEYYGDQEILRAMKHAKAVNIAI